MKKLFLTASFVLATILCSAQFMVVTTVNMPGDDAEWEMSNFTDNIGIGYQLNDEVTLGAMKNGEGMDLWGRYYINDIYASVQAPTEDMMDNMTFGIGYSVKVWNDLYVEPNYMMSMKEDSEGEFKLGISYKF